MTPEESAALDALLELWPGHVLYTDAGLARSGIDWAASEKLGLVVAALRESREPKRWRVVDNGPELKGHGRYCVYDTDKNATGGSYAKDAGRCCKNLWTEDSLVAESVCALLNSVALKEAP